MVGWQVISCDIGLMFIFAPCVLGSVLAHVHVHIRFYAQFHGHGNACLCVRARVYIQDEHGHAALISTCCIDIDMQHGFNMQLGH
jgi:hypothetical protein